MDKQDKRNVMNSLGYLNLSDQQALIFIKSFADGCMFKSPRAYEMFCTDCGIFYTSSVFVMSNKMRTLSDEEYTTWSEDFIDKCAFELKLRIDYAPV